jgi:hypothetical protein
MKDQLNPKHSPPRALLPYFILHPSSFILSAGFILHPLSFILSAGFILYPSSFILSAAPATSSTTPATPEPAAATPKEALRSLNVALRDGDAAAVRSMFVTHDQEGARLIGAMADYSAALAALHRAAEKSYGRDGANMVTGDINAQSADGLASIEKAEVAIEGDHALVKFTGATDPPVKLIRVAGRWKLPLTQLLDGADRPAELRRLAELILQARLAQETANEINAGKYKEGPSRAAAIWRSRLLGAPNPHPTTRPGK